MKTTKASANKRPAGTTGPDDRIEYMLERAEEALEASIRAGGQLHVIIAHLRAEIEEGASSTGVEQVTA